MLIYYETGKKSNFFKQRKKKCSSSKTSLSLHGPEMQSQGTSLKHLSVALCRDDLELALISDVEHKPSKHKFGYKIYFHYLNLRKWVWEVAVN